MLVLIDKKYNLWVDDAPIALMGTSGMKSTFVRTRLEEAVQKGKCYDASFRQGRRSLLIYSSGQMIITHVKESAIRQAINASKVSTYQEGVETPP